MAARPLSAPLQVFERTPELTVVLHEATVILVWRQVPTAAAFKRIDGYLETVKSYGRFAVLVIIEPSQQTPPDSAAREENARVTKKYEPYSVGLATVLEGSTMKHSLIRFALTTMQLMSSSPVPHAVFESVRDANLWLAKLNPEAHSIETVLAVRHARDMGDRVRGSMVWDVEDYSEPPAADIAPRKTR